jgi:hypothetical protein
VRKFVILRPSTAYRIGLASCILSEMDNPETIFVFLKARSPEGICDDCIARETGVAPRQQISPIVQALGLTSDFDRSIGVCFFCQGQKLVTRSLQES